MVMKQRNVLFQDDRLAVLNDGSFYLARKLDKPEIFIRWRMPKNYASVAKMLEARKRGIDTPEPVWKWEPLPVVPAVGTRDEVIAQLQLAFINQHFSVEAIWGKVIEPDPKITVAMGRISDEDMCAPGWRVTLPGWMAHVDDMGRNIYVAQTSDYQYVAEVEMVGIERSGTYLKDEELANHNMPILVRCRLQELYRQRLSEENDRRLKKEEEELKRLKRRFGS